MIGEVKYESLKRELEKNAKELIATGKPLALRKKTTNLFRKRNQGEVAKLDVTGLDEVVNIDESAATAMVGGMTTYETLVEETLKYGFMPAVVPQLKTITLGGAITGMGIESSSFKYGFPHETMRSLDVLVGSGKIITVKPKGEYKDLFYGFANSYGSLGYSVGICIDLIPVKKYVHIRYLRYSDFEKYFSDLKLICKKMKWKNKKVDFVDGVLFGPSEAYICIAQMCEDAPYVSDYTYKNIYFKSIAQKSEDYLTIKDYIWRWDTDWFWCSKGTGAQNPVIRRLYGKKRLRSDFFMKLFSFERKYGFKAKIDMCLWRKPQELVIQDVEIPIGNCVKFMKFYYNTINIRPTWVCPVVQHDSNKRWSLYSLLPKKLYVNFGFWSSVRSDKEDDAWHNKMLEREVKTLKGKKSLYSDAYYSEDEFWELYNKKDYWKLKHKYDKDMAFKNLFEKTVGRG